VNTRERMRAEDLDRYLAERIAGKGTPNRGDLPQGEADLADELVALGKASQPDPDFAAALAARLQRVSRQQAAGEPIQRRWSRWPGESLSDAIKRTLMNKRIVFAMAGVTMLAILVFVALALFNRNEETVPGHPTQMAAATPTAGFTQTATAPAATPTTVTTAAAPTATVPQATATSVPATATSVPATPTEVPVLPTATPAVTLAEPPALPALAATLGSGYGGGGGGVPGAPRLVFVIDAGAALPEGPAQVKAYLLQDAGPLTAERAREIAVRLGLNPQIYVSLGIAAAREGAPRMYIAVDGSRQIVFEESGLIHYTDRQRVLAANGHWNPPEALPSLEQATENAQAFLQAAGLLREPYRTAASQNTIRFYGVQDGWELSRPYALTSIWSDGQVGQMTYQDLGLAPAGEYPLRTAQEAWDLLRAGQPDGRVWYTLLSQPNAWGEYGTGNPKFWARQYRPGQRADLFNTLDAWYPAEPGGTPYLTIDGLVLTGDVQPLAAYWLEQYKRDLRPRMHVWGEVQDAGSVLALQVEGWEEVPESYWSGTILGQGESGALVTGDGQTLPLPDLPADLAAGTQVFVEGDVWEGRLEWYLIQAAVPAQEPPAARPAETQAVVEQVDLIYYVPLPEAIAPEFQADLGYHALQPVWRFRGHTDQGAPFEAYVQAVTDAYLSDVQP
jgi:hypothetical protein